MQHKKVKLCVFLFFSLGFTSLKAQEAIPASGGNATGSGGSASYTVGQVVYTTNTGTTGSVAQGIQQPYEISVVSGIEGAEGISLTCSVYPNPATDFLILKIEGAIQPECIAYLLDINGKLIESRKIESNETTIPLNNFVPATYFLRVVAGNKDIKTFQIIKN